MDKTPKKKGPAKRKTGSSSAEKPKRRKTEKATPLTPAEKQAKKEEKLKKVKLEELQKLFEETVTKDGTKKKNKKEQNAEGDGEMEDDTEEHTGLRNSWWRKLKVPFDEIMDENGEEEEECRDSEDDAKDEREEAKEKKKVKEFISELQKLLDENTEHTVGDDGLVELAQKLVQKLFDLRIVPKEDQPLFCYFVGLCLQWMNGIKTSGFFESSQTILKLEEKMCDCSENACLGEQPRR